MASNESIANTANNGADSPQPKVAKPQKQTFAQKFGAHLRKWWWVHLIIWILITLMIVLLILYIGVKNIVRSKYSQATLTVQSEAVSNPKPDSFDLRVITQIETHTSHKPSVEPFNVSLSLPDSDFPFLYFGTPTLHTQPVFNLTIDTNVRIANMTEFIKYNSAVVANQSVSVHVQGSTRVDLTSQLKYDVRQDSIVTSNGLNGLKGFAITSLQLHNPPLEPDNATMTNTIYIPNPSKLTLDMGAVTYNLFAFPPNGTDESNIDNWLYLGDVVTKGLTLRPGANCFESRGYIDTSATSQYLKDGILKLEIRGNKSVNAQGEELTYFTEALKRGTGGRGIQYDLNISKALNTNITTGECVPPT